MSKVGDQLWEVEWCSNAPCDEHGDFLPDQCEYRFRRFTTRDKADEFAQRIYPEDAFGSVRITPVVGVDAFGLGRVTSYQPAGDSDFYEGTTARAA